MRGGIMEKREKAFAYSTDTEELTAKYAALENEFRRRSEILHAILNSRNASKSTHISGTKGASHDR